MPTFYRNPTEPVKSLIKKFISKGTIKRVVTGFALPGVLFFLGGCQDFLVDRKNDEPKPGPSSVKTVQELSVSTVPQSVSVNQNGPAVMVTLPYTSTGVAPTSCKVGSLSNVVETPPCACSDRTCRVGIQAEAGLYGEGSFTFRLFDSQGNSSNVGGVNVKILRVRLSRFSGNAQRGFAGAKLPLPLLAFVQNSDNAPARGVKVTWEVMVRNKDGQIPSISSCTEVSDDQGFAQCTLTLGTKIPDGSDHDIAYVVASILDKEFKEKTKTIFTAVAEPGLPAKLAFYQKDYPRSVMAGEDFAKSIGVMLVDTYGNQTWGAWGDYHSNQTFSHLAIRLSLNKNPEGGELLSEYRWARAGEEPPPYDILLNILEPRGAGLTRAYANGVDKTQYIAKMGTYALRASLVGLNGRNDGRLLALLPGMVIEDAVGQDFVVGPGKAAKFVFIQQPGGGAAGLPWDQQPKVAVQDRYGNETTPGSDSVSDPVVTVAAGRQGATLNGTTAVKPVNGVATFTGLSIDKAGKHSLVASSPSLPEVPVALSEGFDIRPGAAVKLGFATQPGGGAVSVPWIQQPQVAIQDSFGNTVPTSSGDIALALVSGGSSLIQLSGGTTVGTRNGVATFEGLLLKSLGDYTLTARATNSGFLSGTSAMFSIVPGPTAKLVFTQQPGGAVAKGILAPPPQVTLQDAFGNKVTSSSVPVTLALGVNPANPGPGNLSGKTTVRADKGMVTFAGLSIDKPGNYTLVASIPVLKEAKDASNSFNINAFGPASKLAFIEQPGGGTERVPLERQPQVAIQDALGNTVTNSSAKVTLSLKTGSGVLSGTTTVNAVNGVAKFTGLSIDKQGKYTLEASSSGLQSGLQKSVSGEFTVSPSGTAVRLVFTGQQPQGGVVGAIPLFQVSIQDGSGKTVTTSSAEVTLALAPGVRPGDGVLLGTAKTQAVNGVASFADLSIKKSGEYTLKATSPGLTEAVSAAFTMTHGPAAKLVITTQPGGAVPGQVFTTPPVVEVQDADGNRVTGVGGPALLTISLNSGVGSLSGDTSAMPILGVATWSGLSIDSPGLKTLKVTAATGTLSVISNPFENKIVFPSVAGLTGRGGDGEVSLEWNTSGATSYHVFRGSAADSLVPVGISPNGSYKDSTVTNGTVYHYAVQAVHPGGLSDKSKDIQVEPLSAPSFTLEVKNYRGSSSEAPLYDPDSGVYGLEPTYEGNMGRLWVYFQPIVGATKYTVKYSTTSGAAAQGTEACTKLSDAHNSSCVVPKKDFHPAGETYYVTVQATNEYSGRVDSPEQKVVFGQVPLLSLAVQGNGQVTPTFSAGGATSFDLFYGEGDELRERAANFRDYSFYTKLYGGYTMVKGAKSGDPITGLDLAKKDYFFKVLAHYPNGEFVSRHQGVSLKQLQPFQILQRELATLDYGSYYPSFIGQFIRLSWKHSLGATSYNIQYGTSPGSYTGTILDIPIPGYGSSKMVYKSREMEEDPDLLRWWEIRRANKPTEENVVTFLMLAEEPDPSASKYGYDSKYNTDKGILKLEDLKTYYFRVTAVNEGGVLESSNEVVLLPFTAQLNSIGDLTVVPGKTVSRPDRYGYRAQAVKGRTGTSYDGYYESGTEWYSVPVKFVRESLPPFSSEKIRSEWQQLGLRHWKRFRCSDALFYDLADKAPSEAWRPLIPLADPWWNDGSFGIEASSGDGGCSSGSPCSEKRLGLVVGPRWDTDTGEDTRALRQDPTLMGDNECQLLFTVPNSPKERHYGKYGPYVYGETYGRNPARSQEGFKFFLNISPPSDQPASASTVSTRVAVAGYAGPAMEVRHGYNQALAQVAFDSTGVISPSSPVTITFQGSSSWSAGQTMAFSDFYGDSASVFVGTWYDQSGHGNHAQADSMAEQPFIVKSGVFQNKVVFEKGRSSQLSFGSLQNSDLQGGYSISTVLAQPALASRPFPGANSGSGTNSGEPAFSGLFTQGAGVLKRQSAFDLFSSSGFGSLARGLFKWEKTESADYLAPGQRITALGTYEGDEMALRLNGRLRARNQVELAPRSGFHIGKRDFQAQGNEVPMEINEMVIYKALSADEQEMVQSEQRTSYWGP